MSGNVLDLSTLDDVDDANGAALLDDVRASLTRYVVLPSDPVADAVTLWIAATHAQPAWQHATRLVITSPEKRCGKSRLLDIIGETCHDRVITVNASAAAIFRRVGSDEPPTLLVDEADSIFGTKVKAEQNDDIRALLNAGFDRNRPALRVVGVGTNMVTAEFATFAMAAIAGIGRMPDTIEDRGVVVHMRRRSPTERVAPFRGRRDGPELHRLRDELAAFIRNHLDELADAEPELPVEDRAADAFEPLVAVADLAGGHWPARARKAAMVLTAEASTDLDTTDNVRLLADVRDVFEVAGQPEIASTQLVERLRKVEESPWDAFGLNANGLAQRLRGYGVKPDRIRPDGGAQVRGYRLRDLADTFARYLPADADTPSRAVTPSQSQVSPVTGQGPVTGQPVTTPEPVTAAQAPDQQEQPVCDGVTGRDKCAACGEPMDAALVAAEPWTTTHPGCDYLEGTA